MCDLAQNFHKLQPSLSNFRVNGLILLTKFGMLANVGFGLNLLESIALDQQMTSKVGNAGSIFVLSRKRQSNEVSRLFCETST